MNFSKRITFSGITDDIREFANIAHQRLPPSSLAWEEASRRMKNPVDYMRCVEFPAILAEIILDPGQRILDVGSPQWFSLYLASKFPDVEFAYVNISEMELAAVRDTASVLELKNIEYFCYDARKLQFDDDSFDGCVSISVIEHIEPEVGGDVLALKEIKRVLRPGAPVWLTVPLKNFNRIFSSSKPSYDGHLPRKNGDYFFAREYSEESWNEIVNDAGLILQNQTYIIEKPGPLAIDYWLYGPKRESLYGKLVGFLLKVVLRLGGFSWQMKLAQRNLRLSDHPEAILANLAAHYRVP